MDSARLVDRFADCRSPVRPDTSGSVDAVGAGYSMCLMGDGKSTNNNYDRESDASHLRFNLSWFNGALCA